MAYTPTNWTTGDTITATKLNKMEQGIAEGGGGVGIDVVFFEIGGVWQSRGLSYADAHEKMSNGEPLLALYYNMSTGWQTGFGNFNSITLSDNSIIFLIYSTSIPNIQWTANGIAYND